MYGAILGDIIGSPYEFDQGGKTKVFPLFSEKSQITDDTVMTIAVADALMRVKSKETEEIKSTIINRFKYWGRRYPYAGYGARFAQWLFTDEETPYYSFGNGSAMRVSPVGWLYDTLHETRRMAIITAEVTHNHPEGIKGAEAVASAIFVARKMHDKKAIREMLTDVYDYDLSRPLDIIRPWYFHNESCQQTVPEAVTAFLEGEDFVDVIRNAVSLGGDTDTVACIAGSIAEAYYGVPENLQRICRAYLPKKMLEVLEKFESVKKKV